MNRTLLCIFIMTLFISPVFAYEKDFIANEINAKKAVLPYINSDYNYESVLRLPVKLHINEEISTKDKNIYEGMKLKFTVANNLIYDGKTLLKSGDIINGKILSLITSGLNGIPYSISFGNFEIPDIPKKKLTDSYEKRGFSRTPFVLPLKWALTPLPPTGSLTNFIKGGHAKITPKDDIIIYYYPER